MNESQGRSHELEIQQIEPTSNTGALILALRQAVLREPLGLQFSADDIASEQNDLHFAACTKGELVGCFLMRPINSGVWKLRQFAVLPEKQGQGIGRWMISEMEALAQQNGINQIIMHARESAVPFYEAQGYLKIGERFIEVNLPHWRMEKNL